MVSARDFDVVDWRGLVEPKLLDNFEAVKRVLDNKLSFGFVIDGVPGMSKTTSACVLARVIQPDFDEEHQLGAGIDEFLKAYNWTIDVSRSRYRAVIYDEANDSDRSSSMVRVNRILNQVLLASSRDARVVVIIVLHRFYRLDQKFIDNSLVQMLLHLHSKSEGRYVRFNAYDLDCMWWMLWSLSRKKVVKKPRVYSSTSPNFGGVIRAPPLDYIRWVDGLSRRGKDVLRKAASREILTAKFYSIPVLAGLLGVTRSAVSYYVDKFDLRDKYLRERLGRTLYFDREILSLLRRLLKKDEGAGGVS